MDKKILWCSDLHLNAMSDFTRKTFLDKIADTAPDYAIITGDTGESDCSFQYLEQLSARVACPMYFVNGNHEYYFTSVPIYRDEIINRCSKHPRLRYLPAAHYGSSTNSITVEHWKYSKDDWGFELNPDTVLYGHDGWADGGYGNINSSVMIADYKYIHELAFLPKTARITAQRQLAYDGAKYLRQAFEAFNKSGYKNMIFATHIPPFREACVHEGKVSSDEYLPHFSSKIIGDELVNFAIDNPDKNVVVLSGHTHGWVKARILPNLVSYTGSFDQSQPASDYGAPQFNLFNLSDLGFLNEPA
jgi:predicted phosphodiesterase